MGADTGFSNVVVVGLGLIGGSIVKALHGSVPVLAVEPDEASAESARRDGVHVVATLDAWKGEVYAGLYVVGVVGAVGGVGAEAAEAMEQVAKYAAGRKVSVVLDREGKSIELSLELAEGY